MESAAPSLFLEIHEAEWVCANDLCFAIFDSFPVSPGHVLVITRADFIGLCGQHGVSIFQQTADELLADAKAIADAGHR